MIVLGSSCVPITSIDIEVALKQADSWDVDANLVTDGGSNQEGAILISQGLNELQAQLADSGLEMEWKQLSTDRDGNTPFEILMDDASPEIINSVFFSDGTLSIQEVDGERQVVFYSEPLTSYIINDYSVTLKGKRVLSSNGEQIGGGTVRWVNPRGTMEAVLVEGRPGLSPDVQLLIVGALLIGAAVVYFAKTRTPARTPGHGRPVQVVQPLHSACKKCGLQMPPTSQFCPRCGTRR